MKERKMSKEFPFLKGFDISWSGRQCEDGVKL